MLSMCDRFYSVSSALDLTLQSAIGFNRHQSIHMVCGCALVVVFTFHFNCNVLTTHTHDMMMSMLGISDEYDSMVRVCTRKFTTILDC